MALLTFDSDGECEVTAFQHFPLPGCRELVLLEPAPLTFTCSCELFRLFNLPSLQVGQMIIGPNFHIVVSQIVHRHIHQVVRTRPGHDTSCYQERQFLISHWSAQEVCSIRKGGFAWQVHEGASWH